jgi:hypothetical protein
MLILLSSLRVKNFSSVFQNYVLVSRHPASFKGAYASSRTLKRDAMDAVVMHDEPHPLRTAKPCGPGLPTLRPSRR